MSARPGAVQQGRMVTVTVPIWKLRMRSPGRTLATEVGMKEGKLPSCSLVRQGGFLAMPYSYQVAKNTQY